MSDTTGNTSATTEAKRFPTGSFFAVRSSFNPKSLHPSQRNINRALFEAGQRYRICCGGNMAFNVEWGSWVYHVTAEEADKYGAVETN
jgi:hypothetical protein